MDKDGTEPPRYFCEYSTDYEPILITEHVFEDGSSMIGAEKSLAKVLEEAAMAMAKASRASEEALDRAYIREVRMRVLGLRVITNPNMV
jgi:hypothetical protein